MRKIILGGNWKMQVTTIEQSTEIAKELSEAIDSLQNKENLDVFICPSFNALESVSKVLNGSHLKLGAQNVHYIDSGAFTGEVSIKALKEVNIEYVLVGHSERRRIFNESNETINAKLKLVLEHGLKPVLCIGESAQEMQQGKAKDINWKQLAEGLKGISEQELENIIVAYEPVWAINNKYLNPDIEIRAATPKEAHNSHEMVRQWFRENYSENAALTIRIQYGGSMNKGNCEDLLSIADIDGGLIGGASLSQEKFLPIIKTAIKGKIVL